MTAALLGLALLAAAPDASTIEWVHDDAPRAFATATKQKQLVAVEVWATWCHTCLSMKNYVLTQPELRAAAKQHVWLSVDYDLEKNAAFFAKFPASVFPTFLVLDPKTDTVVARWAGSGSAADMARFFAVTSAGDDPLSKGQRAIAEKRFEDARRIFERALAAKATKTDRHARTRLRLGWIETLYQTDKPACATEGMKHLDELDDSTQGADYAVLVGYCLPKVADAKARRAHRARLARHLARVAEQPGRRLEVDDRSAVLGALAELYTALDDPRAARAATTRRLALLEAAAKAAPTPAARATFDYHRMEAYLQLDRHADAIRMLEASARAQPKDFNHPWRLAKVHLDRGEVDAGLDAIARALERGYGGRKLRLYSTRIQLLLKKGDLDAAAATVKAGRAHLATLEPAQVRDYWRQEFERLARRVRGARS